MAVTVSGIDPSQVQSLASRINEYNKWMDQKMNYIQNDIRKRIDQAYGGNAADKLMDKTVRLMNETREVNKKLITNMVGNINDDLDDTQKTDNSL